MGETRTWKKVNLPYVLSYVFAPILILVLAGAAVIRFIDDSGLGTMILTGVILLMILWWSFFGNMLRDRGEKRQLRTLDEQGFIRNHTFDSDGCIVSVDLVHSQIALIFRWNPGKTFILPAGHISKVWVDDGLAGPGILNGTSRVSFVFLVDGVKVRVSTFVSNRRWRMESDNVLTGISKAEVMVGVLETAAGLREV